MPTPHLLALVSLAQLCQVSAFNTVAFTNPTSAAAPRRTRVHDSATGEKSIWYDFSLSAVDRRSIVAGNWKLNPSSYPEALDLLKLLRSNFINHDRAGSTESEVAIFPPFPFLSTALWLLEGTGIKVGAQNVGVHTKGAFTGEVSPSMLRTMGVDFVMLGHSERRTLFGENDATINKKLHLCLEQDNLHVILCIGETLQEYESDLLETVVTLQVKKALAGVSEADLRRITIAYEPVWAIGTGKVATPDQAQRAHQFTRRIICQMYSREAANGIRIQYGGSVTPESIEDLMTMQDVDGALVGGASLSADSFSRIVDGAITAGLTRGNGDTTFRPKELTARECVSCKNILGESPVWSQRDQTLYWISAPEEECWSWDLSSPPYRRTFDTILGCVALKSGPRGSVVLAGERAFLSGDMSPGGGDYAIIPQVLCQRPERNLTTRPNDGRVDRQNRLVVGMYNNYHRGGSSVGENNAGLYRLNSNLEFEEILEYKYRVSNCICFSPGGETMYFCDTPTRKVYAFDYPSGRGPLTNRRLIFTVPADWPGGPDGATVDAQGFIWMTVSGAGKVVRVDPNDGNINIVVHLPVKSPTSCTFGGKNLDELFITTRGPDGGGLFRVKMPFGIVGLSEPEFKVSE